MSFLVRYIQHANSGRGVLIMTLLLLINVLITGSVTAQSANSLEPLMINRTTRAALLDGRCGNDEWEAATKIELPAEANIYLMYDDDYFYLCASGKTEDYTVLDLYVENLETGRLHKFHLSAQMGESIFIDNEWKSAANKWDLQDYAGFWVPYSGLEDPENRINPKFARGTHRQIQISRNKFPGSYWNMLIGVSGITHEGEGAEFLFPEAAKPEDQSTWRKFSFTK